jgi:hypothetical protein
VNDKNTLGAFFASKKPGFAGVPSRQQKNTMQSMVFFLLTRPLRAPSIPCARTGGQLRWLGSGVPAPVEMDIRGTMFGGTPCYLGNKQHAHRFACLLGRQSLAHEP